MTSSAATPPAGSPSTPATDATPVLRLLQVLALLTVLSIGFQFVTAGRLFPRGGPEEVHAAGAVVLHVVSGLAAIAAGLHWYRTRTSPGLAGLAVVVFVATFVQAATGGRSSLAVHVPGAMVLTVGAVWVLVWSLRPTTPA